MVKRSYHRAYYFIGIISVFGGVLFFLKQAWDIQKTLIPACSQFCAVMERLRDEDVGMTIVAFVCIGVLFARLRSAESRELRRQLAAKNRQNTRPFIDAQSTVEGTTLRLPL